MTLGILKLLGGKRKENDGKENKTLSQALDDQEHNIPTHMKTNDSSRR